MSTAIKIAWRCSYALALCNLVYLAHSAPLVLT